jgi:hypothetical protein
VIETGVEAMRRGARSFAEAVGQRMLIDASAEVTKGSGAAARRSSTREEEEALAIQRAVAPGAPVNLGRLAASCRPALGPAATATILRFSNPPCWRLDRRRHRQVARRGAADVEPAGGGPRLRDLAADTEKSGEREPPALSQRAAASS